MAKEKSYLDFVESSEEGTDIPPPAYDDLFPYSYDDLPPPYPMAYEKHNVFDPVLLTEFHNVIPWSEVQNQREERCSSCFDPIRRDKEKDVSGDMVKECESRYYHYHCFIKTQGPKCDHCCFALIPWPRKHLSGKWVTYEGKRYHEECYEREAGPRCSLCFNVIVEKEQEGFSGQWRWLYGKRFHDECFMKKIYTEKRAKNS